MIEIPEAFNLASQLRETISGKRIAGVVVGQTPHGLAWYYGDQTKFSEVLMGKMIEGAVGHGGLVEISAGDASILFGDGMNIRYQEKAEERPTKHQLLLEFEDGTSLSATVQMYGGVGAFPKGSLDNPYYKAAMEKPSSLTKEFDQEYFLSIASAPGAGKLSLKALLATEQRIPGLGNGVLQDILFNARMNPKRKVGSLGEKDLDTLFVSVKETLASMVKGGGRDTENDLFGNPGKYRTVLGKKTVEKPCPNCHGSIAKESYMGGSVYYCRTCQKL